MPEPYFDFMWKTKDGFIPVHLMDDKHLLNSFLMLSKQSRKAYKKDVEYEAALNAPLFAELSWRVSCPELYWTMWCELHKRGWI